LLGRGRARRIREPISLSRASKGADEVLELASGDGKHASFSRLHPVGVRDALRCQQRLTSAGTALLIPDPVAHLTFKDMEDFILIVVDVQRRRVSLRGSVLKDRDAIRAVL
jgi:hypothetical protein